MPSILDSIQLRAGQPCRDFDTQPSFYLNPDYEDCFRWCIFKARQNKTARIAIIAYCIDDQRLDNLQPHLKWAHADDDWRELVSYSRRGLDARRKRFLTARNAFGVHWIRGPQCSNVGPAARGERPESARYQQLALCTDPATALLDAASPCVVYFDESFIVQQVKAALSDDLKFDVWNRARQLKDEKTYSAGMSPTPKKDD